jgi:membrane protease YdiL (CAAX protease family)
LILVILGVYAASGPLPSSANSMLIAVLAAATVVGLLFRSPHAVHAGLLTTLYFGVHRLPKVGGLWPLPLVIILAVYGLIVRWWPWLRASSGWLRRGRVDRTSWTLIAAFVGASAISLVLWRFWTDADLTSFRSFVPNVPIWVIPIGIIAFASLNAAFEEIVWRGVLMYSLEAAIGPGRVAWILQGIGFGIWHYEGFPSGWVGVGLATIFALMMGALRMRGRGMLAPWIAHVFADVTIFILVAAMVLVK